MDDDDNVAVTFWDLTLRHSVIASQSYKVTYCPHLLTSNVLEETRRQFQEKGTSNYSHKISILWFLLGVFCPLVPARYTHAVNKADNERISQQ